MAKVASVLLPSNLCCVFLLIVTVFVRHFSCQYEVSVTDIGHNVQTRCVDDQRRPQRCIPEFVNAAFNIRVDATNTCGTRGPIEYCLQTGATGATKSCELCDSGNPALAHPADYLTDFNNNDNQTWWQSETMYEGIQYPNRVNLTLNLGKSFDITYVRLKFHSSRPESFAIYKRTTEDGEWIPYQYYSATCKSTYGISEGSYVVRENETKALCTSEFSDISPLSAGNVAFSTLEGRPSAYMFEQSPVLQEWVTATAIRITLDRMNTFGDEIFGDPKVLKSYYYAISDFAVGGRCKCNGHASECVLSPDYGHNYERRIVCRCEHNTDGPDCEKCKPFYNDQPWGRANENETHECKPCNCNGRSEKCYFDKTLWQLTGSGGHCIECRDNTDGPNCERCKENYYEQQNGQCVPCNCDLTGSRNLQCNNQGQCLCKPGVTGKQCDHCAANYYDFTSQGCRPCGCNIAGSIGNNPTCDPVTGVCQCKDNVEGQRCERCKPGFFDLKTINEFGCLPCFCFGHSSLCRSAPGYSSVLIESTFARDSERWHAIDYYGREVPIAYNAIEQLISINSLGSETVYFSAPARFLGDQRASYNQFLSFVLRIGEEGPQVTVEDIVLEGSGLSISTPIFGQGNPLPTIYNQHFKFRLHEHTEYGWNPRLSALDFISLLSNVTRIKIKGNYVPGGTGFIDDVRLESAQRSPFGQEVTWIEMCTCLEGYVGQFCESCAPGYRHDPPGGGHFARCVKCNCHNHAEYCDPETGRCICQHNTAGDSCDRCAPGYYGNALQGTPDDCQHCPCPDRGACVILPDDQVACLQCPQGYTGHRCQLCVDGYYGEPNFDQQCRKCECNGNIDLNAIGNCNTTTGECLKCIYNTAGRHCEKCLPGYYGNALSVPKGDCQACNCYHYGTLEQDLFSNVLICNEKTGQCPCKRSVEGRQCDRCAEGYWNITSNSGCELCDCNPVGSFNHTCDIRTGQCFCRPGVTGRKCDMCLDFFYGFSSEGCKYCECDSVGSLSFQCDPSGQCKCKPNVEGRRCDRCKENKYNKEAECIDCPACYNLVQDAANEHRAKLAKLAELLEEIEKNPQVIDDVNFENKLAEIEQRVKELLEEAQNAAGVDGNLVGQINDLKRTIDEIKKTSGKIAGKIKDIDVISGERNISLAEEIIERAKEALTAARRLLETEGLSALQEAKERSDQFGQQSERMSQIAREARQLADDHMNEANLITEFANDALNTSSEAYRLAKDAIDSQDQTIAEIYELEKQIDKVSYSLGEALELGKQSLDDARDAYNDALDTFTKIPKPLVIEVDTDRMKRTAEDIIERAKDIQEQTDRTLEENRPKMEELRNKSGELQALLDRADKAQQITDELLADADAAADKANKAVLAGDKTLEEAKNTLKLLQEFDQSVKTSKEEAGEAFKKIPEIEQIIDEAEDKTRVAENALKDATVAASVSEKAAEDAQRIAEEVSKEADNIRDAAENTKDKAAKLMNQAEGIDERVTETAVRVKEKENEADENEALIKQAYEKVSEAKTSAEGVADQVNDALNTLGSILEALDEHHDIDLSLLDELERKLNQAERDFSDANLDKRIDELLEGRRLQNHWIRDYKLEVDQLMKDVKNIEDIKNSLPNKCYRRVVLEPPIV
ncbi:laminin subunit gamma-1 [Centruroides vittatus]|uniref:laminin subunit gamma-1 n=1 Tax=Centruroides vittatus TaxID=120091 RepID=UPI00350F6F89